MSAYLSPIGKQLGMLCPDWLTGTAQSFGPSLTTLHPQKAKLSLRLFMNRRDFFLRSAYGLGAARLTSQPLVAKVLSSTGDRKLSASDTITLGKTGLKTSRL